MQSQPLQYFKCASVFGLLRSIRSFGGSLTESIKTSSNVNDSLDLNLYFGIFLQNQSYAIHRGPHIRAIDNYAFRTV
jgi:hypothetical protein